jgi:hypothetical protein
MVPGRNEGVDKTGTHPVDEHVGGESVMQYDRRMIAESAPYVVRDARAVVDNQLFHEATVSLHQTPARR